MNSQQQLKRSEYAGGKDYVNRLKSVLGESTDIGLAGKLGIPKGTIATWLQRNTTPYEISIIVHLATGLSLRWLLLGEGKPFEEITEVEGSSSQPQFVRKRLINGELKELEEITFDQSLLNLYDIDSEHTELVEYNSNLYMINTQENNPVSGEYLIDIDGSFSLNKIQRLPGNKLAMNFDSSSIEVSEGDIKVLGRVVMNMSKE